MVNYIWTTITSISSAKIILRLLRPLGPTELLLQLLFSAETLVCIRGSINVATEVRN